MTDPQFLSLTVVLPLHDGAIERHGGLPRLRDGGLLDSALSRPLNLYAYNPGADLFDLAAAYAFGIARNHAFHDGNKRTAFSTCVYFLAFNGIDARIEPTAGVETMVALASGTLDEADLAAWLRTLPMI